MVVKKFDQKRYIFQFENLPSDLVNPSDGFWKTRESVVVGLCLLKYAFSIKRIEQAMHIPTPQIRKSVKHCKIKKLINKYVKKNS